MAEDTAVVATDTATPATDTAVVATAVQDATISTDITTEPQTDIEKLEAQISQLEKDGSAIYTTAIQALKDERDALIAAAEEEAKKDETEVVTIETSFLQKYGNEILNGVEILALIAIIYRLFFF